MKARAWALGAGLVTLGLFVALGAVTPLSPAGCDLGVLILCVELPRPGDGWSAALAAPGLAASTVLDFAFLAAYALFLAALGMTRGPRALAAAVTSGAILAAGLDGVENGLLLGALSAPDRAEPALVHFAASLKFCMLGAVTAALATRAPRGKLGWVERAGGLVAIVLLATPIRREAALIGSAGLAVAWLAAVAGLAVERRGMRRPLSGFGRGASAP